MNRDDYKSAESLNKNYLRTELKNNENKLLIISGKFKKVGKYYVTFSCIRPYIKGFRTKTSSVDKKSLFVLRFSKSS